MGLRNGKISQERVMAAIVGSYPKPKYIFRRSGRALLDTVGMTFRELEEEIGTQEFKKRLDRAALMAIREQNSAGIDLIRRRGAEGALRLICLKNARRG